MRLAERLKADGHNVHRVNFNCGDAVGWKLEASSFRGPLERLPDFLSDKYVKYGITDQLLFGDRRPVHRPAVDLAERYGIRTHVFEEGYFRPYWVTLEREGVNGHSLLPRDPDWFREVGKHLSDYGDGQPFKAPFWVRAAHDVSYHVANSLNPLFYSRYRTHAPINAAVEYAGYVRRFAKLRLCSRGDAEVVRRLASAGEPFYLLPLQLNSDAQIRDHSRFDSMFEVVEYVMESFARHVSGDTRLVIKNHPLDMGLVNYPRHVKALEQRFGLSGRVDYLETGDLISLLKAARGVVTVNSTVGSLALQLKRPTLALSDPIYNLPGLTFQGTLDAFWQDGEKPDAELFRRFRNTVIHTTQVNGGFYHARPIEMAIENSLKFLEPEKSPLEELL